MPQNGWYPVLYAFAGVFSSSLFDNVKIDTVTASLCTTEANPCKAGLGSLHTQKCCAFNMCSYSAVNALVNGLGHNGTSSSAIQSGQCRLPSQASKDQLTNLSMSGAGCHMFKVSLVSCLFLIWYNEDILAAVAPTSPMLSELSAKLACRSTNSRRKL